MHKALTLLFLLTCGAAGLAQGYTTVQTAPAKALEAYRAGIAEARAGQAAIAQGYFEKALKADPKFVDAQLALADNFVTMRDFFKAEKWFEEAISLAGPQYPLAYYQLANVKWELDKYAECAENMAVYLAGNSVSERSRPKAEYLLASARFAAQAVKNPLPFQPVSVGDSINTKFGEYFPSLTADGESLVFTRRDRGYDENFYISTRSGEVWQTPKPLNDINTNDNEGAQAISPDGTWLVFTGCNRRGDGSQGSCDLYWSQLRSTGWTKPVPFSAVINSPDWDAQPTISADNRSIIFASSRPGGRGDIDLWQASRQENGKWGKPVNLGLNINTPGKDHMPFLHPDGQTLYFASDSLPGMGGNDIFFARKEADGTWGKPQNMGYPINTKGDEGMLVVSLDGKTGYFASDRAGGRGGLDIYTFEMPAHARPQPVTYAKATVTDALSGKPLIAKVELVDLASGQTAISANTRHDGTFLVCLPAGKSYGLNVSKEKYLFYSENFDLKGTATADKPFLFKAELQPLGAEAVAGKPIVLRNVFFETGSAALKPESVTELDRLAQLLSETPELRIQINGHTDNVGNSAANQLLSEARAKAVLDYLIGKGVGAERLRFRGFGAGKPIDTNDTPEGRALNRRTEFERW
jgi:outer membrane protein OmpA-like peptidoglycan-associated protein